MKTSNGKGMDREQRLKLTLEKIEKSFGRGAVMPLGSSEVQPVEAISTGSLSLDIALGVGGIPRGRITEIYGPESGGKTTLSLQVIAEAQRGGGLALFVDAEHALDVEYAKALGVDVDRLYVSQPSNGEEALEILDSMVQSGALDCVVLDSVAALVPKSEIDGDMGDTHVGLQARMMSQAMRKLGGSVSKTRTAAIFINQVREKIGVMFGNPETTPGGRALKFWSSVRLEVRRGETLKQGTDAYGTRTKVKVVKNKVAPPFKQAEFDTIFGQGISREGDVLDLGVEHDLIGRSGTYYNYGDTRLGQGRENAREFLRENPDMFNELRDKLRTTLLPEKVKAVVPETAEV